MRKTQLSGVMKPFPLARLDAFKPFFEVARNASALMTTNWCHSARKRFYRIQTVPLFGHTGHTGYLLGDEKSRCSSGVTIVHFPHIQVAQPDVTIAFDSDPEAAAAIRSKVLDRAAER